MPPIFCVEALEEAVAQYGGPETFNTDQGHPVQRGVRGLLIKRGAAIGMDGKGKSAKSFWRDAVFIERPRSSCDRRATQEAHSTLPSSAVAA